MQRRVMMAGWLGMVVLTGVTLAYTVSNRDVQGVAAQGVPTVCLRDGSCYGDPGTPVTTPQPRPTVLPTTVVPPATSTRGTTPTATATPPVIFQDRFGVCWTVGGATPVPCP